MEDVVMAAIRRNVLDVLPDLDPADVAEDRTLSELGCNSIDRTDVVTMTMDDLAISIPVGEFRDVGSIGSLAGLFRRHTR